MGRIYQEIFCIKLKNASYRYVNLAYLEIRHVEHLICIIHFFLWSKTFFFFFFAITMGRKEHNFWEFFHLATPDNPKANKKAVCLSCIQKYTLPVALANLDCFVSNKAKLCWSHLRDCHNFKAEYKEDEVLEILAQPVPEDTKKK